ncbi:MAG: fdhE [Proteobacteria bacterium]|nr:fdhE [Pseudomonadota bacterium]
MLLPNQPLPSAIAPPTLLAPGADLFARRAARFRHLAEGHRFASWLNWLAGLCTAQQHVSALQPDFGLHLQADMSRLPTLLHAGQTSLQQAWPAAYAQLLEALKTDATPEFQTQLAGLATMPPATLQAKAADCLQVAAGQMPWNPRELSDLLVAAALQVVWTSAAHQAMPAQLGIPLPASDVCPCCGSAPLGSIVLAGDGKAGLRYLECSLCATRWNAVRARCTLCEDGAVVNYLGLEGGSDAVQAETCDACHGYIKTFFQTKDSLLEPLADDLASLALDVLVGEQGYARGAPNLFLGATEPA